MPELARFGNAYDVGVFVLPGGHANQIHVLPNKFFEYVQARLAVAIGPSTEMVRLANRWDFGIVAKTFTAEALAAELNRTSGDRLRELKRNAGVAAEQLHAGANVELIRTIVNRALTHRAEERAQPAGQ